MLLGEDRGYSRTISPINEWGSSWINLLPPQVNCRWWCRRRWSHSGRERQRDTDQPPISERGRHRMGLISVMTAPSRARSVMLCVRRRKRKRASNAACKSPKKKCCESLINACRCLQPIYNVVGHTCQRLYCLQVGCKLADQSFSPTYRPTCKQYSRSQVWPTTL